MNSGTSSSKTSVTGSTWIVIDGVSAKRRPSSGGVVSSSRVVTWRSLAKPLRLARHGLDPDVLQREAALDVGGGELAVLAVRPVRAQPALDLQVPHVVLLEL